MQSQPQLQKGINKVEKPGGVPVFQSILARQLEGRNDSAVWIDTDNESSTYALNSFSPELMDKVWIGRAFTPFQHHSLVDQLEDFMREDTEILALPNITMLYTEGQVREWEARELFSETWSKLKEIQQEKNLKILISGNGFSDLIEPDIDHSIKLEKTEQGLKYSGENQQMAYSQGTGTQTTLGYWHRKTRTKTKVKV